MLNSIRAIQAQQLYKVPPVSYDNGAKNKKNQSSAINNNNFFMNGSYNLEYPKVQGSATLGRNLDFRA